MWVSLLIHNLTLFTLKLNGKPTPLLDEEPKWKVNEWSDAFHKYSRFIKYPDCHWQGHLSCACWYVEKWMAFYIGVEMISRMLLQVVPLPFHSNSTSVILTSHFIRVEILCSFCNCLGFLTNPKDMLVVRLIGCCVGGRWEGWAC